MLTLDEARRLLAGAVESLTPVKLPLQEAYHLRLAEAVHSDIDLPHWDVSAMDGYALRWEDLRREKPLRVAFEVCAGDAPPHLPVGTACRIYTGAVLPEEADVVVPQEQVTVLAAGEIRLTVLPRGSHIRTAAEILRRGVKIGNPGDLLTPGRIALLAAGGADEVSVFPRPRIAIVMTGSELVGAKEKPKIGSIRDSNSPLLQALIQQARFSRSLTCTAPDDLALTCKALEQATAQADLVVTSGGVSVGDWDFVPRAVQELKGEILFHRVSIKPGKPALAAKIGKAWIVGLPGNPVSVFACWRMFALPLGLALAGDNAALQEKPRQALITSFISNTENRLILHPAVVNLSAPQAFITPVIWKGSHDLAAIVGANALLRLEIGSQVQTGDQVEYYPLT